MKYSVEFRVRSYETDSRDVVRPSSILQYMQEVTELQMEDTDIDYTSLYKVRRMAFIVSRMSVDIYRPIYKGELVRLNTWCTPSRGAIYPRYHEFYVGEELALKASSVWGLINIDTRDLVLANEYDTSSYPMDEPPKLEIPTRVRQPKDIDYELVEERKALYSKIDINGHINNTMYPDMLYEVIPGIEEYNLSSINLRFVHEAKLGEELGIYTSKLLESDKIDPKAEKIAYVYSLINGEKNVEATFGLIKR